jgi:hypothetical protein
MAMKIAIVALSQGGLDLARRLQPELDGAVVHGLADRADGADVPFTDTMAHLRGLFAEGTAIIGVFAAGITIRALGPNLANKKTESPVIALAEDGSVAASLTAARPSPRRAIWSLDWRWTNRRGAGPSPIRKSRRRWPPPCWPAIRCG